MPKKTSKSACWFFAYRRCFCIFSIKIYKYRRYLYKHRRYVKKLWLCLEEVMPVNFVFYGYEKRKIGNKCVSSQGNHQNQWDRMENLVRFDWAMKRLLRDKSNYVVLEGFLSTLLGEDLRILRFLESESNQETEDDKFNRVDILVEDTKGSSASWRASRTKMLKMINLTVWISW